MRRWSTLPPHDFLSFNQKRQVEMFNFEDYELGTQKSQWRRPWPSRSWRVVATGNTFPRIARSRIDSPGGDFCGHDFCCLGGWKWRNRRGSSHLGSSWLSLHEKSSEKVTFTQNCQVIGSNCWFFLPITFRMHFRGFHKSELPTQTVFSKNRRPRNMKTKKWFKQQATNFRWTNVSHLINGKKSMNHALLS